MRDYTCFALSMGGLKRKRHVNEIDKVIEGEFVAGEVGYFELC